MVRRKFIITLLAILAILTLGGCSFSNENDAPTTDKYYKVMFYDGSSLLKEVEVKENEKVESFTPEKENHKFVNWYSDSDLTLIFDFNTLITENTNIYAKFVESIPSIPLEPSYKKTDAYLEEFDPVYYEVGWGGKYVIGKDLDGNPLKLSLNGKTEVYEHGIFAHAYSAIAYDINAKVNTLHTVFGLNQSGWKPNASMKFSIIIDGEYVLDNHYIDAYNPTGVFDITLEKYVKRIVFIIDDAGGNGSDHGVWGDLKMNYWRKQE